MRYLIKGFWFLKTAFRLRFFSFEYELAFRDEVRAIFSISEVERSVGSVIEGVSLILYDLGVELTEIHQNFRLETIE